MKTKLKNIRAKTKIFVVMVLILVFGVVFFTFSGGTPVSVKAINDKIKTWTFDSASASEYTYSAPVTVTDAGLKPPANKFSNANFASDITGWNSNLVIPAGWVLVPGNSTFGTSDFLVMKYEAKCASTSDLTTGLTSPVISSGSYDYNVTNCVSANSKKVVSTASGYPIANLTQPEAIALGQTLGSGYHLITNNEWMTIARNAEQVASNWSNLAVGSGSLYSGHNDNAPANALVASTDDNLGYSGTGNSGNNQRRTLALSNNNVIWDLAGNVWEFTNNVQSSAIDTVGGWVDWNSSNIAGGARALYGPSNAGYLSAQGMGQVYGGALNNVFVRGGGWGDGVGAGAFTLLLIFGPAYRYGNFGLRLSSDSVAISPSSQSSVSRAGSAATVAVTGGTDGTFTQAINVGDTSNYALSAYTYNNTAGSVGGTIDTTVASLYVNGAAIATSFSPVAGAAGWYKLTNTNPLVGVNSSINYGLLIKAGKTVVADDMTLAQAGTYSAYTTTSLNDSQAITWDSFAAAESGTSSNGTIRYQLCPTDVATCVSGNSWQYWTGSAWATATDTTTTVNTSAQLTLAAMQAFPTTNKKVGVKIIFSIDGSDTQPVLTSLAIGYTTDTVAPPNPLSVTGLSTVGGSPLVDSTWYNYPAPYFSWIAPTDLASPGGTPSGVAGYYVYFGTDPASNPSAVGTWQTATNFTPGAMTTGTTYYLRMQTQDVAGNRAASQTLFSYKFDNVKPTSPKYISVSPSGYTRTNHFTFLWPTTGTDMATDTGGSNLAAYQYKIGNGAWSAYTTDGQVTLDDVATSGINIFYLQAVDNAGNADDTPAQTNFYYNALAPTAPTNLTATPASSLTNSFAFSWDEPSSFNGTIAGYYYVINPANLENLTVANTSYTTAKSLAAGPYATAQGPNIIYVAAVDEAGNYDLTSCATIGGNTDNDGCAKFSFTANTPAPGIPTGTQIFDISNRDTKEYAMTLKWVAPTDLGAGFAGYEVFRSIDNKTFTSVGLTSGTAFTDVNLASIPYYYYVKSKDNAGQSSAASTTQEITPTGKYTQPPTMTQNPSVDNKAFSATVSWQTSREASSFVYAATSSGAVSSAKANGTPDKVSNHSVILTGLQPETTYYYKVMWEDIDGNQGTSSNYSFKTALRPKILQVTTADITLDSATVSWKSTTIANSVLNFGKTSAYGGAISETSGTQTTNHLVRLTKLEDGTVYHFQIVATDIDGNKIVSDDYSFQTLIRPVVSQFGFEPVIDAPTTTLKFGWKTNVPTTSIVTYQAPGSGSKSQSKAELDTNHEIIVADLLDKSSYSLQARSVDAYGNTAVSDLVTYTTPTDSRPPKVINLTVEVKSVGFGAAQSAQLVVSWETDEAGSSQIEYGPGISSTEYATKTKEDGAMTTTHVVIASGLEPSKIYHLRAVSADASGNIGSSDDTTVITGKVQNSVLDIIMNSLQGSLGWFFTIFK